MERDDVDERLAGTIGARVRLHRVAARQTKVVVAGLAGISADYLHQIERGLKLPTITVLMQLAEVLGVSVDELARPSTTDVERVVRLPAGDTLYRALTTPTATGDPVAEVDLLRHDVTAAWRIWQTSPTRYSQLDALLPELIACAEQALREHRNGDEPAARRASHRCAADLYGLVRSVAKRIGRVDLALLAADRAVRAGEDADDPLRLAVSRWNLAQVLLADGKPDGAESVALDAAEALRSQMTADLDAMALRGALVLVAAIAAVRHGDAWLARERVRIADALATRTGERNTLWTVFGPTNVAMHAVSVEVEAGASADGLRLAEQVRHDLSPSIERRVAFLLDQAKGHTQRRDLGSALVLLSAAEREAPQDVQHRPAARALLHTLVQRGRHPVASEAARLAARAGVAL